MSDTGGGGGASRWEWVAAAVSAVLVLTLIGLLLYEGIAGQSRPPSVTFEVERVSHVADRFLVELRVRNSGDRTARSLHLEGELTTDSGAVETSEATLDFLPPGSSRQAALWFSHDPARYRLQIRPLGHEPP